MIDRRWPLDGLVTHGHERTCVQAYLLVFSLGVVNENVRWGSDLDAADVAGGFHFATAQRANTACHDDAQAVKRCADDG